MLGGGQPSARELPPSRDEVVEGRTSLFCELPVVPDDADCTRKQVEHIEATRRQRLEQGKRDLESLGVDERETESLPGQIRYDLRRYRVAISDSELDARSIARADPALQRADELGATIAQEYAVKWRIDVERTERRSVELAATVAVAAAARSGQEPVRATVRPCASAPSPS